MTESTKITLTKKKAEDEQKLESILTAIGKSEVKPAYLKRLKSKDSSKPAPIFVELADVSIRNPVLLAAKKLRDLEDFKLIYISPDLIEAERQDSPGLILPFDMASRFRNYGDQKSKL